MSQSCLVLPFNHFILDRFMNIFSLCAILGLPNKGQRKIKCFHYSHERLKFLLYHIDEKLSHKMNKVLLNRIFAYDQFVNTLISFYRNVFLMTYKYKDNDDA